jgi:hypothetical protein
MPRKVKTRAYANTTVAISKSREAIDEIIRKWGVVGIQWEDDFDIGYSSLRFRWKRDNEEQSELVARFRLDMESEEALQELAVDKRSGQFSDKKYDRLKADRGKREHRILLNLLKNMFEAIEEGIMPAEALLLPWIEDSTGKTVYEKLEPNLNQLSSTPLHKALSEGSD